MNTSDVLPVKGIRLGTAAAGIRKAGRDDVLLMELAQGSQVAAVFTRNAFCAAPVIVARQALSSGAPVRGLLINSGNANAGTGDAGIAAAEACCAAASDAIGGGVVLPFSTGVIGEALPVEKVRQGIKQAQGQLAEDNWAAAARAIMTTDTVPKVVSRVLELEGQNITITGIAKGAGMIRPDMATMLAYIACDAAINVDDLKAALSTAVDSSFNRITIDGDTSTNDACVLVATAQGPALSSDKPGWPEFVNALTELCEALARELVRDGEGANHLISIEVIEAENANEARGVADTVAHSPLVKTACFAKDPNWGRILAAVGRSPIAALSVDHVQIWLDDVQVLRNGALSPDYVEAEGTAVMAKPEYTIRIALGRGQAKARIWTCDFSYDYVRINAEYRS